MDSGSGSLQSSSGGDDEYDSRTAADSIPPYITSAHLRPIPAPPQPLFNPLPNYMQLQNSNPVPLNPTQVWTGPQRSDFFHPPTEETNHAPPIANHTAARNPKKRSRASRRAPTTVLTTDTSNFRAMVQEFTGIPAAPFSNNSSSFPPPYLRRPFPQKVQSPPSFLSSNSLLNSTTALHAGNSTNINQNSNLFNNNINIPNPFLASLLQTNPKFLFTKPDHHHQQHQGSFENPSNNDHDSNIKTDGLDVFEFGHGNQHVTTGLPNLISSDQVNDNHNSDNNVVGPAEGHDHGDYEARVRSVNGGFNFNGEIKGSETSIRGDHQGMVESWICSSELK